MAAIIRKINGKFTDAAGGDLGRGSSHLSRREANSVEIDLVSPSARSRRAAVPLRSATHFECSDFVCFDKADLIRAAVEFTWVSARTWSPRIVPLTHPRN